MLRTCWHHSTESVRRTRSVRGRRGVIGVRWLLFRFRSGPQSGSLKSVSAPCPLNRMCGHPGSGSLQSAFYLLAGVSSSSAQGAAGRDGRSAFRLRNARISLTSLCVSARTLVAASASSAGQSRHAPCPRYSPSRIKYPVGLLYYRLGSLHAIFGRTLCTEPAADTDALPGRVIPSHAAA